MRRDRLFRFIFNRSRSVSRATYFPVALCFGLSLSVVPLSAQTNHDLHHNVYQNWVNKLDKGCCNNQDCGEIADENIRENGTSFEVKVEGSWCEVKSWMYLKNGNAPDWSKAHVCVLKDRGGLYGLTPRPVCDRLICFQPKPLF